MAEDGGDTKFIYSAVIFALAVLFLMPVMLNVVSGPSSDNEGDAVVNTLLSDYSNFTGNNANLGMEDVWLLSGIYTPYLGGAYNFEPNGWLFGSKIGVYTDYLPTQYVNTPMENTKIIYDPAENCYKYSGVDGDGNPITTFDGHKTGDIYTAVSMDLAQKSDIFFTSAGKHTSGSYFWYEYSGYRYEFTAPTEYTIRDSNGNVQPVSPSKSGLSLIWYDYLGGVSSGISGQLILSSDLGVAFLTTEDILKAYENSISTARFELTFSGINVNVYIRINPYYISQGLDVAQCWEAGYWDVMVTTNSASGASYEGADYQFSIYDIWDTFISLFTFNTADYGLTGTVATIASVVMVMPMYACLIAIGASHHKVLIIAGILASIQAIATAIMGWGL